MKKITTFLVLIFLGSLQLMYSQDQSVSGKVTDGNTGEPLPGVNVVVAGTTNGTITDIDGAYTIQNVPADASISFSFVGYLTETIAVAGQSNLSVNLIPDITALSEVVVVGYGTQRKEAVTGSVASIGGDEIRAVASSNITQALQGRLPGVQLSQTSSKPGAEMQIRIRGTRSLSADNNPLIVLDGIPFSGSIGDINPSDIKSIDILKDASATAIYGSRGANGVILLTTNKGRKDQKPQVTYNGYYGWKKAIKVPMMNGAEYSELRDLTQKYPTGEDESDDMDTDWQDLFYRTGIVNSQDVGMSGGTEKGSYNFGVGYYEDQAVIPTQQYKRISVRAALDQEINKYLKVGFMTNNNYNITEGNQIGMYTPLSLSPLIDPYNEDGSYKRNVKMAVDETWLYTRDIIEEIGERWVDETRAYGTYNSFYGEVKIPGIEGLKYRVNTGLDLRMSNSGRFTGQGVNSTNPDNESSANVDNRLTTHWVIENLLTYDRTIAKKHNINIVGLYSAEETMYNRSYIAVRNIPEEGFQFYNLGYAEGDITIAPSQQDYQKSGLISWMGRAMYDYDGRYMLSATLRSDGSSRLAPGYKWHTYPAVSAGWNIAKESFMENVNLIDRLKIRAGYGQTSNQAVAPYATLGRLSTVPYNFGADVNALGAYVSSPFNPELGWEYSETKNIGVDFSMLNSRLSGTVEYYITDTKDLLFNLNLPPTAGVSSITKNIGATQNKGFEFSLNGVILDKPDGLRWDAGINIYSNNNAITSLASGQERDDANGWFVGYPINSIFDYKPVGLWQEEDADLLALLEPGSTNIPGMIRVEYTGEYNEDGTPERRITEEDRQIMSLDPDFLGGFNTVLSYKGLDLNIVGTFQRGGLLISSLYSSSGYLNMLSGRRNNVSVDYWTPENTDATFPNPLGPTTGDNPKYGSTMGYFDGSYLKIRTISLGYSIDQNVLKSTGIQKLRVYFSVQNPLVLFSPYHKISGMDPETNSYGNENAAVPMSYQMRRILTVGANTPSTKNFIFGINATF
ncbi:MAG: TonB-dependent receptor [Bacteroidales bacterium]|nr:TonB-dependent receptor [Bacteroidales bacterium]MBN2818276.1 TonB-dependent receptor [Bacteroidales bacterium]